MAEPDGDIYRELGAEMRHGLKQIYQQISSATDRSEAPEALFCEASDQLKEVVKATESAAMNIMEIVEQLLDQAGEDSRLLKDLVDRYGEAPEISGLIASNARLVSDLTQVLTALSFQDITGQRIKKVMGVLEGIERSVVDLYLASGIAMACADEDQARDIAGIRAEANKAVENFRQNQTASELKGPSKDGISQKGIDEMLAQLGL